MAGSVLADERTLMGKFLKVILFTVLLVLVLFALLADMPFAQTLNRYLDFALYTRLASLLGLLIALVWFWERKKRTDASQKIQRANEVLAETEEAVRRRQQAIEQMEKKLASEYAEKEKGLDAQIHQIKSGYDQRIKALNEQNVELKDTVSKLMAAMKKERRKGK
jgi:septin family protein